MFFDFLSNYAQNWPPAAVRLLVALLPAVVLWHLLNKRMRSKVAAGSPSIDRSEPEPVAYAWNRLALVSASIIAMLPSLARQNPGNPWGDLVGLLLEAVWVLFALLVVSIVVDKAVLLKVDNHDELLRDNRAMGAIQAGFYIGFGAILGGSLYGTAPTAGLDLATTIVFALLGLAVLLLVYVIHEWVTPWSIRDGITQGNLTPALEAAGVLAGVGIVTSVGVAGDFTDWGDAFGAFFATVIIGIGTQYLFRWVTDKVLMPNCTLRSVQANNQVVEAGKLAAFMVVLAMATAIAVWTQL